MRKVLAEYHKAYLEEMFGVKLKDGIQSIVMQVCMLLSSVVVEVNEVFYVVMRSDIFNVLSTYQFNVKCKSSMLQCDWIYSMCYQHIRST